MRVSPKHDHRRSSSTARRPPTRRACWPFLGSGSCLAAPTAWPFPSRFGERADTPNAFRQRPVTLSLLRASAPATRNRIPCNASPRATDGLRGRGGGELRLEAGSRRTPGARWRRRAREEPARVWPGIIRISRAASQGRQDRGLRLDEQKPGEARGVTDALRLRAAVESLIPRRSAPTKSRDRWRVIGWRDGTE